VAHLAIHLNDVVLALILSQERIGAFSGNTRVMAKWDQLKAMGLMEYGDLVNELSLTVRIAVSATCAASPAMTTCCCGLANAPKLHCTIPGRLAKSSAIA